MNKIIGPKQFQLNVLGNVDVYWVSSIDKMLSKKCSKTNKTSYFVMLIETGYWTPISEDFYAKLKIIFSNNGFDDDQPVEY